MNHRGGGKKLAARVISWTLECCWASPGEGLPREHCHSSLTPRRGHIEPAPSPWEQTGNCSKSSSCESYALASPQLVGVVLMCKTCQDP